jgi:hypothetical protein
MPRTNRPRGKRSGAGRTGSRAGADTTRDEIDLSRALYGSLRTEQRRDGLWNVQPVSAASAVKSYLCPGCRLTITPGIAHTVAWRADGIMGETEDIAARRHWHNHCWKISS